MRWFEGGRGRGLGIEVVRTPDLKGCWHDLFSLKTKVLGSGKQCRGDKSRRDRKSRGSSGFESRRVDIGRGW